MRAEHQEDLEDVVEHSVFDDETEGAPASAPGGDSVVASNEGAVYADGDGEVDSTAGPTEGATERATQG